MCGIKRLLRLVLQTAIRYLDVFQSLFTHKKVQRHCKCASFPGCVCSAAHRSESNHSCWTGWSPCNLPAHFLQRYQVYSLSLFHTEKNIRKEMKLAEEVGGGWSGTIFQNFFPRCNNGLSQWTQLLDTFTANRTPQHLRFCYVWLTEWQISTALNIF